MKILITNHTLRQRGGSELFTAEIALALRARGHDICVFSTDQGVISNELEKQNIPVINDPADCPFTPDIIHGQHHLETMTALCLWPGTPAVYMIHGSIPWEELPPSHPRIMQYLAPSWHFGWIVEQNCGVDKNSLGIVRNFYDPERYPTVRPSQRKTGRALLFHNSIPRNGKTWATLKTACEQVALSLEGIGEGFEKTTKHPETLLPDYDVVFAAGRSAIEALACGCTVILIGSDTMTARVHPENYDTLLEFNFCPHDKDKTIESSFILAQLHLIKPNESAEVTARVRRELSIDSTLSALEKFYQKSIEDFASCGQKKASDEKLTGAYLLSLSTLIKGTDQRRADLVEQKQNSRFRAEKWKTRAEKLERRMQWVESQMKHKSWWHARLWRVLQRKWEANERRSIND